MSETASIPGLFIGGLRSDLHPAKLAGLICSLLARVTPPHVQIPKKDIHITLRPDRSFAIVDLPDLDISNHLLSQLSSLQNIQNIFDLSTITLAPHQLKVAPKRSRRSRSRYRARQKKKKQAAATANQEADSSDRSESSHRNKQSRRRQFNKRSVNKNQSNTSLFSDEEASASQSESDTESDEPSQRSQSTSKGNSNSTVSSKESEEKLHDASPSKVQRLRVPKAGGVRRLTREFNADAVGRSVSDRSMCMQMGKTSITTSTTGLPAPGQVSVTTSTPGIGTGMTIGFYQLGQTVGRESRHSEFKQGGVVQKDRSWLQETVGKYTSGFLNSGEGGTLYLGVSDQGVVMGFPCPQSMEDNYRLQIDEALKSIEPPIFTDAYNVHFVPVMGHNGKLSETHCVLVLEIKEIKHPTQLYIFRGNAFLRRDGSLQGPLKARQVQEWTRQQLERQNSGNLLKSQLRETMTLLEKERETNADMKRQLLELEDHITKVKLKHKQSKVCLIM